MEMLVALTPLPDCPSDAELRDFRLGRLSEPELDAVADHVSSCSRCEAVLSELDDQASGDSLIDGIRRCWAKTVHFDEPPSAVLKAPAQLTTTVSAAPFEAGASVEPPGPAVPDVAGRIIGPYELICELGRGGMGVVYQARHRHLEEVRALKMILAGPHASPAAIARFIREGKALTRLTREEHPPNIVRVFDFDFDKHEGLPYYAMELVQGGSLRDFLTLGPLEPREAAALVGKLAMGVEFLHSHGVLHRDLKPANILMDSKGVPKIADFGLAKLFEVDPNDPEAPTWVGSASLGGGTVAYMAPEQAAGRPWEIGLATDIHALGIILYECLTGQRPFVGKTDLALRTLISTKEAVPPSRHNAEIAPELEAICLKCLEKKPAQRYASAQRLADDLERWLRDEQPQDTPTWFGRLAKSVRRHAAVLIGVAMLGSTLVALRAALMLNSPGSAPSRPERVLTPDVGSDERTQADESARLEIEAALVRGQPVTLVGEKGVPRWSEWQTGSWGSHLRRGDGGVCTIESGTAGLLEIVPDPQSNNYRLTAQIRHELSDAALGEVGIYFARKSDRVNQREIHFFTQVSFNAVWGDAAIRERIPVPPNRPLRKNFVGMFTRLLWDEHVFPNVDHKVSVAKVAEFEALGEKSGRWNDLVVDVTPTIVTVRWNEQSVEVTPTSIQHSIDVDLKTIELPLRSPLRGLRPQFRPRGGLGLYVRRGTASFRRVSVIPLSTGQPSS
jgi:serine/threonine-protein kinase